MNPKSHQMEQPTGSPRTPPAHFISILLGMSLLGAAAVLAEQDAIRRESAAIAGKGVTIERTYRGKECVMFEMQKGKARTRCFLIHGKVVAAESDEDGDGFFETITVFSPDGKDFDCFIRASNGVVVPLDPAKLGALKAKKSAADDELDKLLREVRERGP